MKFFSDFFKQPKEETVTTRKDSWFNPFTNLGSYSRSNLTKFSTNYELLSRETLNAMYRSEGLVRKVVDIFVDESLRSFIQAEDEVIEELNRLNVKSYLTDACKDARLFGGSVLVAFVDDGRSLTDELDVENINRISTFRSYDRWQVTWQPTDIITDYMDENFGDPLIYTIQPVSGLPFEVHKSRLWRFRGGRTSALDKYKNLGWDDSVIQPIYYALRNLGNTMNSCAEIVQEFITGVLYVDGLTRMMSLQEYSKVEARLHDLKLRRSTANMLTLDSESEKYEKLTSTVAGLPDLWDRFSEVISATTDIPLTKLLGKSPSGLGATGRHEEVNWNNKVEEYRNDNIKPALDWVLELIGSQKSFSLKEDFEWSFNPLSIPDPEEKAKVNLMCAQLDQVYIDRGGVDAQNIFKKRYENGEFNPNIILTNEDFNDNDEKIEAETLQIMQEELESEKQKKTDSVSNSEILLMELINRKLEKFNAGK